MLYQAEIEVCTRNGVLNPESKAILHALRGHDFAVLDVTMNKKFYLTLESDSKDHALKVLNKICEDFLANPIIQDYTIHIKSQVSNSLHQDSKSTLINEKTQSDKASYTTISRAKKVHKKR
ncbi:phosphoribosylformylglycinamidine synthase, purS protein [Helicobacter didelphidarum]|uniref:Phosphoribosylformylglycinamidine synthase subunit PurS n=1 Tax=Helicobacter didelphidarum TaxID=2040648 RepID=A0A3D8IMA4_9HELI|nr:phosphoribosylformylglycinamidine synthase subunit PurS [Helicobacter didelphidarum]RDU65711.1 phosphoribosylformylglycinamidine synthase, purS protein [Helicobacter didelphidarum]